MSIDNNHIQWPQTLRKSCRNIHETTDTQNELNLRK